MAGTEILYPLGFAMIIVGTFIILLAVFLLSVRSSGKGKIKGGGAVIIGPVPIIFGTDRKSLKSILLLSIVLTVLLIVFFVVQFLLLR